VRGGRLNGVIRNLSSGILEDDIPR